jgi:hypothetical protein
VADPLLSEVNALTYYELYPDALEDNFFKRTATLAYIRDHAWEPYRGGSYLQWDYAYAPMIGGPYQIGETFNTNKPQTKTGAQLDMKQYEVNVTEFLEQLDMNRGDFAVFSQIRTDLDLAVNTMNAIVNIALFRHGQAIGTNITDNRVKHLNGFSEIINNGTDNSWDGNVFSTYGGQTRGAAIGAALSGNIKWAGDQSGNPGQVSYPLLLETYTRASRGADLNTIGVDHPTLGVTTKAVYNFCLERMQTQQRFMQERDPIWGSMGFRIQDAMLLPDDYCPSQTSQYGVNDANLGNYSTGTFTSVASPTAYSNLPGNATITVGEVLFWLNTTKFKLRVSDSKLYGFGWKPFIMSADNTKVSGQILARINLEAFSPWAFGQVYGLGS